MAMKMGHCCAEPFPVVTMGSVSAARAFGTPAATTRDASIPTTRPIALMFTLSFFRCLSGGPCNARAAGHRRQQRQHLSCERFQSSEHGVEMQEEQFHPDLLIAAHALRDQFRRPHQARAERARRGRGDAIALPIGFELLGLDLRLAERLSADDMRAHPEGKLAAEMPRAFGEI